MLPAISSSIYEGYLHTRVEREVSHSSVVFSWSVCLFLSRVQPAKQLLSRIGPTEKSPVRSVSLRKISVANFFVPQPTQEKHLEADAGCLSTENK